MTRQQWARLTPALAGAAAATALTTSLVASAVPAHAAAPPTQVTVKDGRTSPAAVDISTVQLSASSYWYSTQAVDITVPGGFHPGNRVTVWYDVAGKATPGGHITVSLGTVPTGAYKMSTTATFRRGGGWSRGGTVRDCTSGDDHLPATPIRPGETTLTLGFDVWSCLGVRAPSSTGVHGAWRASVLVSKGKLGDMAPSGRKWSPTVAGWEACEPGDPDGDC